jgi:hypothetical protein
MVSLQDKTRIQHINRSYAKTKWIAQTRAEIAKSFPNVQVIITETPLVSNPSSSPVIVIRVNAFGTITRVYIVDAYTRGSWMEIFFGHAMLVCSVLVLLGAVYYFRFLH